MNLEVAWSELEKGISLRKLAARYNVSPATLIDKLSLEYKELYTEIMRTRRSIEKTVDLKAVWNELNEGTSLTRIAKEHDISRKVLTSKLTRDDQNMYAEIMRT